MRVGRFSLKHVGTDQGAGLNRTRTRRAAVRRAGMALAVATGVCLVAQPLRALAQDQSPRPTANAPTTTVAPTDNRAATATPQRPAIPTTRESRFSRSADAEIRFQEGLLHYNRGQLAQAEQDFRGLLSEDPNDIDSHYYLGLSVLDQNRPADSVPSFDKALQLDPSFDEVRAARATALIRTGQYDLAQADIDSIATNPRFKGLTAYLRGQLAYAKGDLDAASKYFAEARESGEAEATPAGFYEGLTYLRMKQLVRARQAFNKTATSDADRDPTLAGASRQLDAVLARQEQGPTKKWEAQLAIAYEYDTNVIQIGSGIPSPTGISDEADSRIVLQPRGSYSFIQNEKVDLGIEANGYFAWQQDLSDFDVASYQLGPYVTYTLKENLYASLRYGYNYIDLGHDPYLSRNLVTPALTYVEKNFGYTSAYYQFQARQFDGDPGTDALDRDGPMHSLAVVQGIKLPALFKDVDPANIELSYRLDRQQTKGSDFDGWFNTAGVVLYTPLPLWKLHADLGTSLTFENYDNPNSLDANGDQREDWEWNISAGLTRQITKEIAFRVDYTYTDHLSNVETAFNQKPYEYDRHQFGVRLIFSF